MNNLDGSSLSLLMSRPRQIKTPWKLTLGLCFAIVASIVAVGCETKAPSIEAHRKKSKPPFVPEQQIAPPQAWIPARSTLPAEFVSAVQFIQAHGLPDPRGGKIVRLSVLTEGPVHLGAKGWNTGFGSSTGSTWENYAHASLLIPGWQDPKAAPNSVITADGRFLRPPKTIETAQSASLADEFLKSVPAWATTRSESGYLPMDPAAMFAALLLIDGKTTEAERVYHSTTHTKPPLECLAQDFITREWDRACMAFHEGDDAGAKTVCAELVHWRTSYASKLPIASTGYQRVESIFDRAEAPLADVERRLRSAAPQTQHRNLMNLHRTASDVRIDIADLDDFGIATNRPTPYVTSSFNPEVLPAALAAAGKLAVDPLIDCVLHDPRWTRQLQPSPNGFVLTKVSTIALQIAYKIVPRAEGISYVGNRITLDLPSFERWWSVSKNLNAEQLIYRTLSSDTASPKQWADAMQDIIVSTGIVSVIGKVESIPSNQLPWLHQASHPTVSSLMAKRIQETMDIEESNPSGAAPFDLAGRMTDEFWSWDPASSVPVLKKLTDRVSEWRKTHKEQGRLNGLDSGLYSKLIEHRRQAGDHMPLAP